MSAPPTQPTIAIPPPMPASLYAARRVSPLARSLALGFAGAVAMWAVAYVALMRPGAIVGEALFALTLACVFIAGFVSGRERHPKEAGWAAGAKAAFVTATLNLLLIGSLAGEGGDSAADKLGDLLYWTLGNYAATLALGAIGGAIASVRDGGGEMGGRPWRDWFSLLTRVAAATVFLLLITGGLVTTKGAGLAVPDWPNSFGHNMLLYPLSQMTGGIYYEHAHRLYGMLVGVTALTLALSVWWFDQRRWLRTLAVVYLLMVSTQGVLGGTRVTEKSLALAIAHGVFGQVVFATVCAIAVMTSRSWSWYRDPTDAPAAKTDRRWTLALVVALLLQLGLGAMYRHLKDSSPGAMHVLYTHILGAVFVAALAIFAGGRAWRGNPAAKPDDQRLLMRCGKSVIHTVGLQIVLGVVAMIAVLSRGQPTVAADGQVNEPAAWVTIFSTAHQAIGAMLLALATTLMLWTRRVMPKS